MKRAYNLSDKALVSKIVINSNHLTKFFLTVGVFACMIPCMKVHAADVNTIKVVGSGSGLAPVSIPDVPITATSVGVSGVDVGSAFGDDIEINATEDVSIDVSGTTGRGIYGHTQGMAGDVNITVSGGTISATGIMSYGIEGAAAIGNVTINSSANISSASIATDGRGILGVATAGNVSITAAGNVNGNGAGNFNAIEARASSASGNVSVHYKAGTITATAAGIYADTQAGGLVTVTTDAGTTINSGTSGGIVAYNAGTGVSDSIVINNAADISSGGYSAIRATTAANATTYITSSGNLTSVTNSRSAIHAKSAIGNIYIGYNSDGTENAITGTITTSGSGAHGIFADSGTGGIVSISNAADITASGSGSYGIYVSGATTFGVLQNTGKVYGTNDNATAIRVDATNVSIILGTGSDLRGDFVSGGSGNALVLQGTATENSNFSATSAGNRYSLTVSTNADWTLNGSSSQLDGVNRVILQNVSTLRMRSNTVGAYTFNRALSGSGTLDIALANGSDEIILDNSINSGFIGTYALGKGTFVLSDSQDNSGALAGTTLRLEDQNTTIIDGAIDRHNVNLDLASGSTLAYNADGLLTINNLSLDISGDKVMIDFSDYFSGNVESSYTLISISGILDAESAFLTDAENAFGAIGGLAGYAFAWNDTKDQLLYMDISSIPEPSSYAVIFAGVMFMTIVSRRRYRK